MFQILPPLPPPPIQAVTTLTLTQAATHRETHSHRPCLVWGRGGPILVCAPPRTTHFDCATVNLAASHAFHSSPVSPLSLAYPVFLRPRLASSYYIIHALSLPNAGEVREISFTPFTVVWGNVLYLDFNNPSLCCVVV